MSLNIVFMGTPEFSVPTLEALIKNKFNILRAYTQPPKKSNRGQKVNSSPIEKFCKKNKIILIEDNAICFDNFKIKKNNKTFTGRFGDYSLYSFNIMKNISALYGGGVSTKTLNLLNFVRLKK